MGWQFGKITELSLAIDTGSVALPGIDTTVSETKFVETKPLSKPKAKIKKPLSEVKVLSVNKDETIVETDLEILSKIPETPMSKGTKVQEASFSTRLKDYVKTLTLEEQREIRLAQNRLNGRYFACFKKCKRRNPNGRTRMSAIRDNRNKIELDRDILAKYGIVFNCNLTRFDPASRGHDISEATKIRIENEAMRASLKKD